MESSHHTDTENGITGMDDEETDLEDRGKEGVPGIFSWRKKRAGEDARESPGKTRKKRVLKWRPADLGLLLGVVFSIYYQYYIHMDDTFIVALIFSLIVTVGIGTAIVWRFTATWFTPWYIRFAESRMASNPHSYCLIRSRQSAPSTKLDHLQMALEWCLFPTLMVFFILSHVAGAITPEGERIMKDSGDGGLWWLVYLFMFLIPPLGTFIVPSMRIIEDSSLVSYDIQRRIIEPYGTRFRRMFRAIGGVGALATFLKVALVKGGVQGALEDTFTVLLFTLPTIFIATIVYGMWHTGFVGMANERIDKFPLRWYDFTRVDDIRYELKLELMEPPGEQENGEMRGDEKAEECADAGVGEGPAGEDAFDMDGEREDFAPPVGYTQPVPTPPEPGATGTRDHAYYRGEEYRGEEDRTATATDLATDFAPPVFPPVPGDEGEGEKEESGGGQGTNADFHGHAGKEPDEYHGDESAEHGDTWEAPGRSEMDSVDDGKDHGMAGGTKWTAKKRTMKKKKKKATTRKRKKSQMNSWHAILPTGSHWRERTTTAATPHDRSERFQKD